MRVNLTKKDLINSIYMQIGFSKKISENLLEDVMQTIIENLKKVYDPEMLSLNIYDLGLIYDIKIDEDESLVEITHTLTSAFCPFADEIVADITKAGYVPEVLSVEVITTFDPPFTMDNVPEETKMMMGW